ncbi:hypothetical protein ACFFGH_14390 [Lysobacter korlensis]|uniref:Uncharacterized protein n=1 Tax=Lysobacter korlensis TaxID=553636 RepID=A0ABV6RPW9_9GAMM
MPAASSPVSMTSAALDRAQGCVVAAPQVDTNNPRNNNVSPPQAGD